jgi:precorrin-4 C11-methyltransferase
MKPPHRIALIAVSRKGIERARLLRQRLRAGNLYRPAGAQQTDRIAAWEHCFDGALSEQVGAWFSRHDQLVFFLAAGAVTRLIAPWVKSKESDPGVLALDEAGHFVIPLLSGHRGGANAFTRTVAGCLGATPVVTTASDVVGGLSLDLLEDAFGWTAEPHNRTKDAAMALVNKEPVAIVQEIGARGEWLDDMDLPDNVTLAGSVAGLAGRSFAKVLCITDSLARAAERDILYFRPKSLVLGVGCERGLPLDGLREGLRNFLQEHGYAQSCIDTLASANVKADEGALVEMAQEQGWQTAFYTAEELAAVPGIVTPSEVVQKWVGTPGVAEPAALLAASSQADNETPSRLLVKKQVVRVAGCTQAMTFALARHARFRVKEETAGRVSFIGAGPGDPQLLTLKAQHRLRQADVVIYAGSLVPEAILRHAPATAAIHNSAYLTLEEVMALTLAAVRAGQRVVRLQSGDTSLYSAIQEQIAILEEAQVEFEVVPGISAFQAAAAVLKTELTLPEKVQTIILTRGEGNTPMPEGEALAALAQHRATLCIYLSALLVDQVQEQLLAAYPPETPVAVAYRISWPDEQIIVTRLDQLAAEVRRHEFKRTTLLVVGEAVGGRGLRSHLYDEKHGHLFRKRSRAADDPAP